MVDGEKGGVAVTAETPTAEALAAFLAAIAGERSDGGERDEEQQDLDVIDHGVADGGSLQGGAEHTGTGETGDGVAQRAAKRHGEARGRRLRRAPGAEREPWPMRPSAAPSRSSVMAAVSVPTEKSPPPKPTRAVPTRKRAADSNNDERITMVKPATPPSSPMAASRGAS